MPYKFGKRSLENLEGVHPDLVRVAMRALEISPCDFGITEGLRSKERQEQLVKENKSQTRFSRHITGHAIDVVAWVGGEINWSWNYYEQIAGAMKRSAHQLGIGIEWGGDWKNFPDGVHFQLPKQDYP